MISVLKKITLASLPGINLRFVGSSGLTTIASLHLVAMTTDFLFGIHIQYNLY